MDCPQGTCGLALRQFLGSSAGLSASVITKLTETVREGRSKEIRIAAASAAAALS
jgi:cellobiose-specific phosphotransferase system component IIB